MPRARVKTVRAIEPNAGLRAGLQKRLAREGLQVVRSIAESVLRDLAASGFLTELAEDASLRPLSREEWKILGKARWVIAQGLNPEVVKQKVDALVGEQIARHLIYLGEKAKRVSTWYTRAAAQNITAAQKRALSAAGVAPSVIRQQWRVPLVKQHLSPGAVEALPGIIEEMTGLITRMHSGNLAYLREVLMEAVLSGQNMKRLAETLETMQGFSEARAKRVALDQSIKINSAIQRENAKALGIREGIWVHVPGTYSSRETHVRMNGKRFDLEKGLYDSDVGEFVLPGVLPFCRCQYRSVLPKELLGE